jgi:hypothetical protein
MTDLSARPLGLAEIIDRSVAIGRRHFRALFVAMLLVSVPGVLMDRAFLPDPLELLGLAQGSPQAWTAAAPALLRVGLILLGLTALHLLATGAAAAIVEPTIDPRRGPARPSLARRGWATLSATVLQVVLLTVAPAAGALPGAVLFVRGLQAASPPTLVAGAIGAVVGGVGLFLVVTLRLMLAPAVAALEGRAGLAALSRSFRLMGPRPGVRFLERPGLRASLVLLAVFVLATAVSGLAGLPRLVAQGWVAPGRQLLGAHLPLGPEVIVSLLEAALTSALQPFLLVAVVVFYFDRRARTEALDLELWAEGLEAGR